MMKPYEDARLQNTYNFTYGIDTTSLAGEILTAILHIRVGIAAIAPR